MKRRYSGFSLNEVLISIVVLGLGVLGVARMQLNTLVVTRQLAFHATAVGLASEMTDKIRANAASMGEGDNPFLGIDYSSSSDEPAAQSVTCFSARCNALQLAEFDIHDWEKRVQASLPSGRARVCRDDAPWGEGARNFRWECSGSGPIIVKIGWRSRTADSVSSRSEGAFSPVVVMSAGVYPA